MLTQNQSLELLGLGFFFFCIFINFLSQETLKGLDLIQFLFFLHAPSYFLYSAESDGSKIGLLFMAIHICEIPSLVHIMKICTSMPASLGMSKRKPGLRGFP